MWYFIRNSDRKEFMLVSAYPQMIKGVAQDGETCILPDGEYSPIYKTRTVTAEGAVS